MARFLRWYCGEWTAMNDLLQNHIQDIPFPIFDRYCGSWECYMEMAVYNRQWPLHPNEMLGLERERARLNDAFLLYTRLSPSLFALAHRLASSWEAKKAFGNAEQILLHPVPYNSQRQRVFYGKLRVQRTHPVPCLIWSLWELFVYSSMYVCTYKYCSP